MLSSRSSVTSVTGARRHSTWCDSSGSPLLRSQEQWQRGERAALPRHADVTKAMDYALGRGDSITRLLDDGRSCLTNDGEVHGLHGVAVSRKSTLFAGFDRGGERPAEICSLIIGAERSDVEGRAWPTDVFACISDRPASRVDELPSWYRVDPAPAARGYCGPEPGLPDPPRAVHRLQEVAMGMEPEEGRMAVLNSNDGLAATFTARGLEVPAELLEDLRSGGRSKSLAVRPSAIAGVICRMLRRFYRNGG
jgi:Transposase IS66 family